MLQYYTINQTDERNKTLLHWAVWNKHLKGVKEILHHLSKKSEKKAFQNFINQEDSDGYTALHYALDRDTNREYNEEIDCEILKNILAYSDNEAIYTADKSNKTLLHWAVWNKHLKGVKEILHHLSKKAEKKVFQNFLNQKDRYGYTALHYAVDRDANRKYSEEIDCKILKNILAYSDSEAIHAVDKNGMTALHWAVKNNNLKAVALILEHTKSSLKSQQAYGAFIKAKTLAGCPAIYWTADAACSKGELARAPSLKIFNLLLHALPIDACGINDQDNEGYTMAHWAAVQGRNDILKVLIQHEANCNIQDKKGRTPLHVAIEAAYHVKLKTPSSSRNNYGKDHKIINQLLEVPGIDLHIQNQEGYTPVELAWKLLNFQLPLKITPEQTKEKKTLKRSNSGALTVEKLLPLKKRPEARVI